MNSIKCSSRGCEITTVRCKSVPSPSHLIRHKEMKLYVEKFISQRKSTGQQLHKDHAGPHLTPSGYCLRKLRCPTCGTPRSKINASSPWNPKSHLRERNGSKSRTGFLGSAVCSGEKLVCYFIATRVLCCRKKNPELCLSCCNFIYLLVN